MEYKGPRMGTYSRAMERLGEVDAEKEGQDGSGLKERTG